MQSTNLPVHDLYREYHRLLQSVEVDSTLLDYSIFDAHRKSLSILEAFEGNCYQIFDMNKRTHIYHSPKFNAYFGLEDDESLDSRTLPEDLYRMTELGIVYLKYIYAQPPHERKKYKLTNDFRIILPDGEYMRVMKNYVVLETDYADNIWLSLCSLSISVNEDVHAPVKSRIVNIETGEVLYFPEINSLQTREAPFSEREIEVIELLSRGYSSKQIAPLLNMSIHTVNTHRQNVIRKVNMKNTMEVVKYAADLGLLGASIS